MFRKPAYWGWWTVVNIGGKERKRVENIMRKRRQGKKDMGKRVAKKVSYGNGTNDLSPALEL